MTVTLRSDLERLVQEKIQNGEFDSVTAVLEHALALLTKERTSTTAASPTWAKASPSERAAAFERWAASHSDGPGLPEESVRRDSMYD
jgi:Arc/MetJ-type ribon-helix-helix transcriptional regulator